MFQYRVNFKIHLDFFCVPACLRVCMPIVRPGCVRCTAPEISDIQGNDSGFKNLVVPIIFCPMHHDVCFEQVIRFFVLLEG